MLSLLKNNNEPLYFNIEDIDKKENYIKSRKSYHLYPSIKKNGQMKLLVNEIRFLSYDIEIHNLKNNKFNLLYIGSGKGYHIPFLMNMYKNYNINWYFYDPVGHCDSLTELNNDKTVFVRDKYFLEEDMEEFKNSDRQLIFISDIRTVDENSLEPRTKNLYEDYILQNKILDFLKPDFSLLKYRVPFKDDWNNDLEFFKPKGKEYIQAFTKNDSCEFRIFLNSIIIYEKIKNSDLIEYENKFYWYNTNYRIQKKNDLQIALFVFNCYNHNENKIMLNRSFTLDYLKNISKLF